jgi:hypothetical protein
MGMSVWVFSFGKFGSYSSGYEKEFFRELVLHSNGCGHTCLIVCFIASTNMHRTVVGTRSRVIT